VVLQKGSLSKFLVHPNFKDVYVEVIQELPTGRTLLAWYNLGFAGKPWQVPVKTTRGAQQLYQWVDTKNLAGMVDFDPTKPETHPGRKNG
jgi:hypothetical protein